MEQLASEGSYMRNRPPADWQAKQVHASSQTGTKQGLLGMAERPSKDPWHAIAVIGDATACVAALKIRGKRVLSADAPRLPLADCSSPTRCRCVYRHFADRRAGLRRAADRGMFPIRIANERRASRGRRAEDLADTA
jgi:hypothetical protein